ncbi:transposase [Streptomyces sp. NPDC056468]|uniref:transposase n=1 Tax=Streptomyces sp. NPDC056468 TaxID=3345830 RepID=UPI0036A5CDDF
MLGQVYRKNSWQLAEYTHATPHSLQLLLPHSRWDTDGGRDDLQAYVAEQLGQAGGVLILDGTGFVKKGTASARVQRPISGTAGRQRSARSSLPKSWTSDRDHCQVARIPDECAFATKGDLARDM